MANGHGGARPGAGRKHGSTNKKSAEMAEILRNAFEAIGGERALAEWAKDNPSLFYSMWVKMLPHRVEADVTETKRVRVTLVEVDVNSRTTAAGRIAQGAD